jgi:hypothetical protein
MRQGLTRKSSNKLSGVCVGFFIRLACNVEQAIHSCLDPVSVDTRIGLEIYLDCIGSLVSEIQRSAFVCDILVNCSIYGFFDLTVDTRRAHLILLASTSIMRKIIHL